MGAGDHAIRSQAEARVATRPRDQVPFLDAYEVLRELELYKLELEVQSEELRATKAELEASRARYVDLFRAAPVAYLMLRSGDITDANDMAAKLLDVPPGELKGARLSRFVDPANRGSFYRFKARLLRGEERARVELRLVKRSGELLDARLEGVSTSAVKGTWRTAIIDLTPEKRLARQLVDLRRADAVGPVTRELAHEVGHLLMNIVGALERVLTHVSENEVRRAIASVRNVALRGGSLAERILARARGQGPSEASTLLDAAILEFTRDLCHMLPDGARVTTSLSAAGIQVPLDDSALVQILSNLVKNAFEAMPAGSGEVHVATYPCDVEEATNRAEGVIRFVVLEVSDTGPGLSPRARAHLLEPNFSTKPRGAGGGVGLTSVWALLQGVGGRLRVESAEQGGASVRVHLPISRTGGEVPAARDDRA